MKSPFGRRTGTLVVLSALTLVPTSSRAHDQHLPLHSSFADYSVTARFQNLQDRLYRSFDRDCWFALDKLAHLLVSLSLFGIGFAVLNDRGLELERDPARILSAGGTVLIGLAKEIHDYRQGAGFSRKDLAADGLGIALGILVYSF